MQKNIRINEIVQIMGCIIIGGILKINFIIQPKIIPIGKVNNISFKEKTMKGILKKKI